jgi:hypothetical protein
VNIGEMRPEKVLELGSEGLTPDMIENYAEMLENKDAQLRDYFEPNYIAYETLDESILFGKMAQFGEVLCPELEDVKEEILEWAINVKQDYANN